MLQGAAHRHLILTTDDVDELTRVGSEVFSPHRLRYAGHSALLRAVIGDRLSVITMRYRGEASVVTTEELGYFAVHLPQTGHASVRFSGHGDELATDTGVVFNPQDRPAMRWSADLHQYGVKIPTSVLRRHLAVLTAAVVDTPLVFTHPGQAPAGWGAATRMLVGTLGDADTVLVPAAMHSLEDSFLTTLLYTQPSNWSERLRTGAGGRSVSPELVRQATDLVHDDPSAAWSVAELARATGASARTLHEGFRVELATTPMRFVRDARLRRAHELLRSAENDALTVADIASLCGFGHLGRFAALYRERYGILPSAVRPRAADYAS